MQEIIIIAGPNGAGKTSFANKHFERPRAGLAYLNADEIARELTGAGIPQPQLNIRAGHEWYIWDGLEDEFRLAEAWND